MTVDKKKAPFGPWYVKMMAILGLMTAIGIGKPWSIVAFAGEVKEAVEKTKKLEKLQEANAALHRKYDVLNAAQETKVDMLTTIMLQQARGATNGSGARRAVDEAINQQLITLATRIADLNADNVRLRSEAIDMKAQLEECREEGE